MTLNGCGMRQEIFLRILSVLHLLLVVSNFFVLDPRLFSPLYVIYSIGVICFFTLCAFSFVAYQAWFLAAALSLQVLYIISAGYLASLALMGYFAIKTKLLFVVFGTNFMVIIVDVVSMISIISIRSEQLRKRAETKRARRSDLEAGKY